MACLIYKLRHILLNMSQTGLLTIRAAALTGFAALCRSYGADAARALRRAGLPVDAESQPDRRLPVTAVNLAMEIAAAECGCDDFGLRLSELRGFANLGPIGLLARDEPTIGAALAAIEAYLPLHNDALVVSRERFDDVTVVRCVVLAPGAKVQARDVAVAMLHRIVREIAGSGWSAEEVCLTRSAPADRSKFRQVLGSRLRFAAEFDGVAIGNEWLERPNPLADAGFRPYASQLLRLTDPGGGQTMSSRVRRVLALLLPSGRCTSAQVAARLGMSRRTLVRGLEAEGTRFLALLDAERSEVACRQLAANARSVAEISDLLGFASPAAFSTWFRRCHGTSPREWARTCADPAPDFAREQPSPQL